MLVLKVCETVFVTLFSSPRAGPPPSCHECIVCLKCFCVCSIVFCITTVACCYGLVGISKHMKGLFGYLNTSSFWLADNWVVPFPGFFCQYEFNVFSETQKWTKSTCSQSKWTIQIPEQSMLCWIWLPIVCLIWLFLFLDWPKTIRQNISPC